MKEMTLEEVKIYVLEHFCEYLPECYQKSTLRVESVVKNNQRLTGISLAGVKISPTIYLENIYEEYLEHKSSLCQILRKKANLFYERMKNGEEIMTYDKHCLHLSKQCRKRKSGNICFLPSYRPKITMRFWNIASIENSWIYLYYVITNFRLEKSC